MKLAPVIEKLEDVAEPLRDFYVPSEDGKAFHLEGLESTDDVAALKRSLENAKKERAEAKKALESYKGIDPEEFANLKKEREERELAVATKKGEYEKLLTQVTEKHKGELATREMREKALLKALEQQMVDAEAARAIAAAKGSPELLIPHVRSHVRVVEDEGKFVVKVVDREGNPRIGDATGTPMTIPQLVAEMRSSEVYGRAFDASGASGGGAPSGRSTPTGTQDISKLSPVERMNASRAQPK